MNIGPVVVPSARRVRIEEIREGDMLVISLRELSRAPAMLSSVEKIIREASMAPEPWLKHQVNEMKPLERLNWRLGRLIKEGYLPANHETFEVQGEKGPHILISKTTRRRALRQY